MRTFATKLTLRQRVQLYTERWACITFAALQQGMRQMNAPALTANEIDKRIEFHDDDQIMEVSFEDLNFSSSRDVNQFYDRIEERIAETGHDLWFFLVNYGNTRIEPAAWIAFSRRGKALNLAHSMGSVRFDAAVQTQEQIESAGQEERFDANLFRDREKAIEHLCTLPSQRMATVKQSKTLSFNASDLNWRFEFIPDEETFYVDFSDMSFEHSVDVDYVYDFIEDQLEPLSRKWYFLVNYNGTRIQSPAWVRYSARGKKLNETWSLGSVRFAAGSETETEIRLRAESQGFRPNIRNTIIEAKERIREMRAEAENN